MISEYYRGTITIYHQLHSKSGPKPEFLNFKEPKNWFQGIHSAKMYSLSGQSPYF